MIVFDLQCVNGHCFEGWFQDHQAFEDQLQRALVACPVCDNHSVFKILSPVAVKTSDRRNVRCGEASAIADISKKLHNFIDKNFENVGCDFAKEALRIHFGVAENRSIRGVSTPEEERLLKEEGVQFFKFPVKAEPESDS